MSAQFSGDEELDSWESKKPVSVRHAMLQAQEAVAGAAEDPRNTKAAMFTRANSIMKALDDVGSGAPVTSWQRRAVANGGMLMSVRSPSAETRPPIYERVQIDVNRAASVDSPKVAGDVKFKSLSIGRSSSDQSDQSWIQRSLRVSEEVVRQTELDPRNKRQPGLSRKDSVLHAMQNLNITLEDLHDLTGKKPGHSALLAKHNDRSPVVSRSMSNIFKTGKEPDLPKHGDSFKALDQMAQQRMGLWGSMKRVKDASHGSGKRLVGVNPAPAHSGKSEEVVNMLPAALGIFRDVTRVMEALCTTLDRVNQRIGTLEANVKRLQGRDEAAAVKALEESLSRLEKNFGVVGGTASTGNLQSLDERLAAVERHMAGGRPKVAIPRPEARQI